MSYGLAILQKSSKNATCLSSLIVYRAKRCLSLQNEWGFWGFGEAKQQYCPARGSHTPWRSIREHTGVGRDTPLRKGEKMKKTTNIYILADTAYTMTRHRERLAATLAKMSRALGFTPERTKLHIWGYSDKVHIIDPRDRILTEGNPNLAEGLKAIKDAILYERKYAPEQTRSIFLLFSAYRVLDGWQKPLDELFRLREFALGHRYAISYGEPERFAMKAYRSFTDTDEKILPHFSEGRLCSLVADIHRKEKKKCYNSYTLN